jgi:hypothetical protein
VTTPAGAAPLPLSFGEFDRWNARWSPDGKRIALISNEHGNTELHVRDVTGGGETLISPTRLRYKVPHARLTIAIDDEAGKPVSARFAILGSDARAAAPASAWMHGDDGFDRSVQQSETHYFDCDRRCTVELPAGSASLWIQHGFRYLPWKSTVIVSDGRDQLVEARLRLNDLPASFEQIAATQSNVGRMRAAGINVSIGMIDDNDTRNLFMERQYAGNLVALQRIPGATGVSWGDALAMITSKPAQAVGMGGEIGSLAPGRRADLVVWSGDPLEGSSAAEQVFIDGVRQPLDTHQTRLLERYRYLPRRDLPEAYRH